MQIDTLVGTIPTQKGEQDVRVCLGLLCYDKIE